VKKFLRYFFLLTVMTCKFAKRSFCTHFPLVTKRYRAILGKVTTNGHLVREQRKPPASRRLPEQMRKYVRSHINKFSTVPSHYCRHTLTRQYLPENLTFMEIYRMYENECQQQNITPAKKHQ